MIHGVNTERNKRGQILSSSELNLILVASSALMSRWQADFVHLPQIKMQVPVKVAKPGESDLPLPAMVDDAPRRIRWSKGQEDLTSATGSELFSIAIMAVSDAYFLAVSSLPAKPGTIQATHCIKQALEDCYMKKVTLKAGLESLIPDPFENRQQAAQMYTLLLRARSMNRYGSRRMADLTAGLMKSELELS